MIMNQVARMIYPRRGEAVRLIQNLIGTAAVFSILAFDSSAQASVGQIVGTIYDDKSGEPLIGASVQVEGTSPVIARPATSTAGLSFAMFLTEPTRS